MDLENLKARLIPTKEYESLKEGYRITPSNSYIYIYASKSSLFFFVPNRSRNDGLMKLMEKDNFMFIFYGNQERGWHSFSKLTTQAKKNKKRTLLDHNASKKEQETNSSWSGFLHGDKRVDP